MLNTALAQPEHTTLIMMLVQAAALRNSSGICSSKATDFRNTYKHLEQYSDQHAHCQDDTTMSVSSLTVVSGVWTTHLIYCFSLLIIVCFSDNLLTRRPAIQDLHHAHMHAKLVNYCFWVGIVFCCIEGQTFGTCSETKASTTCLFQGLCTISFLLQRPRAAGD